MPCGKQVFSVCNGALNQIRTGDLVLTKDALCRLSYKSKVPILLGFFVLSIFLLPYPLRTHYEKWVKMANFRVVGNLVGKSCFLSFLRSTRNPQSPMVRAFIEISLFTGAHPYQGRILPTELQKRKSYIKLYGLVYYTKKYLFCQ